MKNQKKQTTGTKGSKRYLIPGVLGELKQIGISSFLLFNTSSGDRGVGMSPRGRVKVK